MTFDSQGATQTRRYSGSSGLKIRNAMKSPTFWWPVSIFFALQIDSVKVELFTAFMMNNNDESYV